MLSPGAQYQRMQQNYLQRPTSHPERFQYLQQYKPISMQRPPNMGHELLTKLEQAGKVPSREKFRRMCCQTFLSTGGCPYNDRCVFLHDPRLHIESFRLRTVKNVRQSGVLKDTFYWPDMERGDVSLLLDAQGLPDAKQAYTIPKEFSLVPHASHHDRALYSMWNHFIDACVEGNLQYNNSNNKSSSSMIMNGVSSSRQTNNATTCSLNNGNSNSNYSLNTSYPSPSSHVNQMSHQMYQMTSPMSVTTAMFSPQGMGSFSTPGTPSKPQNCRLMALSEIRAQSNFSGVSRDLSLEFGLGLNDQKRSGQGTSVWDLKEGKRQLQSILHINMTPQRNKHLKGVWRLPIFITLSDGTGNAKETHSTLVRTINTDIEFIPPAAPSLGPIRINSTPVVIRPIATQTPGRMQSSLPPAGSYPNHDKDCQLHDLYNGHHNHPQHQEQHYGDNQERALYSEALRATVHPVAMVRSTPVGSPTRHYRRALSPPTYDIPVDNRDDNLTHFVLPRSVSDHPEPDYDRNQAFSFDQGHAYESSKVQNGQYQNMARIQSHDGSNQRPAVISRSLNDPHRQPYEGEISAMRQGHQMSHPRANETPAQFLNPVHPHSRSASFVGFLRNSMMDSEQLQLGTELSCDLDDMPYMNYQIPSWQRNRQAGEEESGYGHFEQMQPSQSQYMYFNGLNQNEPSLELKDPAVISSVSAISNSISDTRTKAVPIDRWNDGYNRETKNTAAVAPSVDCDWTGTPSSQTEAVSTATIATSWESINSAFSRDHGVESSPSMDSFTSDLECTDDWKPFGDVFLCPSHIESKPAEGESSSHVNCDEISSEKDD